ncbi:MAG: hypothetical protein MHM6MM_008519, partial [Cercozoa sp. M6MM]
MRVDSPLVQRAVPVCRRGTFSRGDVLPFVVLHGLMAVLSGVAEEYGDVWHMVWMVGVALSIFTHAVAHLSTHWSKEWCMYLCYRQCDLSKATSVYVVPPAHSGSDDIVALRRRRRQLEFTFQMQRFVQTEDGSFEEAKPLHDNVHVGELKQMHGLSSDEARRRLQQVGHNSLDFPLPTFVELFQEHAVAPFFVFQVACVFLWMFDDMLMYSLFTLLMLVMFESAMVWRRRSNMRQVRDMRSTPVQVWVHRDRRWHKQDSGSLVPGDIVLLQSSMAPSSISTDTADNDTADNTADTSTDNNALCPCDCVILHGQVVLNEALLTGESVPQIKEALAHTEAKEVLDTENRHRANFVAAGCELIRCESPATEQFEEGKHVVSTPPSNGAVAVVLRTGFGTAQGKLLRTILYSTQRVTVENKEAFLFIGFLLCFALVAAGVVLHSGLQETAEERPRLKLLLNCVMIVTAVVPPELP